MNIAGCEAAVRNQVLQQRSPFEDCVPSLRHHRTIQNYNDIFQESMANHDNRKARSLRNKILGESVGIFHCQVVLVEVSWQIVESDAQTFHNLQFVDRYGERCANQRLGGYQTDTVMY